MNFHGLQDGGANPFPTQYLTVITPGMEASLNAKRVKKATSAYNKAIKEGASEQDARAIEAEVAEPVVLGEGRLTIVMANGAEAGYSTSDRNGVRHADGKLKWTMVHGAPEAQFDAIRHRSVEGEKKGQKELSLGSAKRAFNRYYNNREYTAKMKDVVLNGRVVGQVPTYPSRKAAMTRDLNYAPKNDEDIVTTRRYLRNPAKFDYKGFDDSTGPLSKFKDGQLHRMKPSSNPRTKEQLAAQWPVAEFQEQGKDGVMKTVRHRVDEQGNKLAPRVSRNQKKGTNSSHRQVRRNNQSEAEYRQELDAKNEAAKAKRAAAAAANAAVAGGSRQRQRQQRQQREQESSSESEQEQHEEQRQRGGRAVSLKTAVRLLRSYYNNKYNKN